MFFAFRSALVWCGIAVFPQIMFMIRGDWSGSNALFSVPFIVIGFYFILGRFLLDIWVRRGMQYAVTNKRILILRSGPFSKFTALNLDRLTDVSINESASGRGTIRFGAPVSAWGRNNNVATPALDPTPQFLRIENARSVFDQIQQMTGRGG